MSTGSLANDAKGLGLIALRGVGQVMFQGNAGTGLLFLIGIAVASPLMAVGAAIGAVIGPGIAHLLKFDRGEIEEGIHGFNPTLVGVATLFYLRPTPLVFAFLVAGCVAATLLTRAMRRYLAFPTYTAPFVLTTWLLLGMAHGQEGTAIDVTPAPLSQTPVGLVDEVLRGAAEVMFGANELTGILFLVGIALSDWRQALVAFLGSLAGTLVAVYHGDPAGSISVGIYGYNAALAAMAAYLWRRSLLIPLLAAMISVPFTEFFPKTMGVPPLTAPFVAAAWVVIAVGGLERLFLPEEGPSEAGA